MELFKKKITKTKFFLIFSLVLFVLLIFTQLILVKPYKSKATVAGAVEVFFDPASFTGKAGQMDFVAKLKIRWHEATPIAIQLYKVVINFDKTKIKIKDNGINYLFSQASAILGADTNSTLSTVNGTGQIKIIGEITSPREGKIISTGEAELASINFQLLSSDSSLVTIDDSQSYLKKITESYTFEKLGITGTSLAINGATTEVPVSETPTGQPGNTIIKFLLKFQGVNKPIESLAKMPVKLTFVRTGTNVTKTVDFDYDIGDFWLAKTSLNLPEGSDYKVLVKGPKHLQKKICHNQPVETFPGTYSCDLGEITLIHGENLLDFSNIYLLVGDLPNQDGISNAYDSSLVRNNLGKSDADSLRTSDLNLDGMVNAQDFSLIISALSVRADEL